MTYFAGVRVLELGGGVAANAATRIPAEFGPAVVKVEEGAGDPLRAIPPPDSAGTSALLAEAPLRIEVPALVAHAGNVDSLVMVYRLTGVEPERGLYGSQAFPAGDGYVLIANPMAERFPNVCRAMGRPELLDDDRF